MAARTWPPDEPFRTAMLSDQPPLLRVHWLATMELDNEEVEPLVLTGCPR
jgi:hypothetical protein